MTRILPLAAFLGLVLFGHPVLAERPAIETLQTSFGFEELVQRVKDAVKENGLIVVYAACASCAAKGREIDIAGNAVIGAFNNVFAVRMLEANVEAGIEAPLEFYITGAADGSAALSYRLPSAVFAAYESAELEAMAAELDTIWTAIIEDATGQ